MPIVRYYQLKYSRLTKSDPSAHDGLDSNLNHYLKGQLLRYSSLASGKGTPLSGSTSGPESEPEFTVLLNETDTQRRWFPRRRETSVELVVSGTPESIESLENFLGETDVSVLNTQTVSHAALIFYGYNTHFSHERSRKDTYLKQLEILRTTDFPNTRLWTGDTSRQTDEETRCVITGPVHEVCGFRQVLAAPGMVMAMWAPKVLFPYTQQNVYRDHPEPVGRTL